MTNSITSPSNTLIPSTTHEFVEAIKQAQSADQQVYTLEKLTPVSYSHNALTPSYFNLIISPFIVVQNLYKLSTKKIQGTALAHEIKNQAAIHILNFMNMTLKTTLLIGIFVTQVAVLAPYIIVITFLSSLIGIYQSIHGVLQQKQFSKEFDLSHLNILVRIQRNLKKTHPKNLQTLLNALIRKMYHKEHLFGSLIGQLEGFKGKSSFDSSELNRLKELINQIQNTYLLDSFEKIKEKYFVLSSQEKQDQLDQALQYFSKLSPEKAYKKSMDLIESAFLKKKLALTTKIHAPLTLHTIQTIDETIQNISECLQSKTVAHKATLAFRKINKNARTKQVVLISNIALYAINLSLAALHALVPLNPFATASMIIVSTGIYWLNHLEIYGHLETTKNKIDLVNCLPDWALWIHNKIWKKPSAILQHH